jgi:hypothetical protein
MDKQQEKQQRPDPQEPERPVQVRRTPERRKQEEGNRGPEDQPGFGQGA